MIPRPSLLAMKLRQAVGEREVIGEKLTGGGTTYSLDHTPVSGTVEIIMNEGHLVEGATEGGFSVSGNVVTTTEDFDSDAEGLGNYKW